MIFGKTKLELKVGIFVFIGLIILSIFILSIGKFRTWMAGYRVNFIFNFINGVKEGAPVRFAGVDVGEVKKIKFIFLTKEQQMQVHLESWVKKNIKIPLDSTVWVNTLGLLGEKYIEIMPGRDYSHCLVANQSLVGIDPIPMHEVFRLTKGFVEDLDETVAKINSTEGTVGRLLHDDTLYKNLEAFSDDIKKNPWKLFIKTKEKK
jgi:phospholipid/cholesterol/gamma-HCH transport system substrate-binding protein